MEREECTVEKGKSGFSNFCTFPLLAPLVQIPSPLRPPRANAFEITIGITLQEQGERKILYEDGKEPDHL